MQDLKEVRVLVKRLSRERMFQAEEAEQRLVGRSMPGVVKGGQRASATGVE